MPDMFLDTGLTGTITFLGHVPDREAALAGTGQDRATVTFAGIEGESHGGLTRPACTRVTQLHPVNTEIRNVRQLTILSAEEMADTAKEMGVDALDPAWIGASIVVSGIPDFTHLPPSARLQGPDGVTLVVDMLNHPCTLAGKSVDGFLPGEGPKYKPAAMDRRGVTAWVEREGTLSVGEGLKLFVPAQRAWRS